MEVKSDDGLLKQYNEEDVIDFEEDILNRSLDDGTERMMLPWQELIPRRTSFKLDIRKRSEFSFAEEDI